MNHELAAVILAGGESSRFRKTRPEGSPEDKLQAELVDGKTAIDLTLDQLEKFEIPTERTVIVVSPNKLEEFREKYPAYQVVLQEKPLGNADAASQATWSLDKWPEITTVILVQGDDSFTYFPEDYVQLTRALAQNQANIAVMVLDPKQTWDESTKTFWHVGVDAENIVHSIKKGPISGQDKVGGLRYLALVNAFAIDTNTFVDNITGLTPNPAEKNEIILPDFMKRVLANGGRILAVLTGKFLGFNDFEQYQKAQLSLKSQ